MKRILIVSDNNPFLVRGGVAVVVNNIIKSVIDDYDVYLICYGSENKSYSENNVKIIQIKKRFPLLVWDIYYAIKISKATKQLHPDLVIDNCAYSFLNSCQEKTISIAHGTNWGYYQTLSFTKKREFVRKIYRYFWMKVQQKFLKKCLYVVGVALHVCNELEGDFYKICPDRIVMITNGTFINISKYQEEKILSKKPSKTGLFISFEHKRKGIDILEEVALENPEVKFLIAGEAYESKIDNVKYLGVLTKEELVNVMVNSDFYIFPSKYEGQSLTILDALAMGLVLICSEAADPGIIAEGINGYIISEDGSFGYTDCIRKLYKDDFLLLNAKKRNIALMKKHTWDIVSVKYKKLVDSILN